MKAFLHTIKWPILAVAVWALLDMGIFIGGIYFSFRGALPESVAYWFTATHGPHWLGLSIFALIVLWAGFLVTRRDVGRLMLAVSSGVTLALVYFSTLALFVTVLVHISGEGSNELAETVDTDLFLNFARYTAAGAVFGLAGGLVGRYSVKQVFDAT